MRNTIRYMDPSYPIVGADNVALDAFRIFIWDIWRHGLLIGEGSPEGVVEAPQGQEYMDENGSPGSIKYIKQVVDVGGDRTRGWVAIG